MNIHFYVNSRKPAACAEHETLLAEAAKRGLRVVEGPRAEIVIALGGDGTILHAVHDFPEVPVLGLNLGGLGYLSSVGAKDAVRAIGMLAEGRFSISSRTMLAVKRAGDPGEPSVALNDVVLVKEMSGHAARLALGVDGKRVNEYVADGLIFATPTGSTAYSLSSGGPVLMPDTASLIVTPMNPHALGARPLVVCDNVRFSVETLPRFDGKADQIGVYADGESALVLSGGETLEIWRSSRAARLVTLEGYDPYEVLSRKLGWKGSCL